MKRILVAVDGSEPSLRALKYAADLAKALGANLIALMAREFHVGRRQVFAFLNDDEVVDIQEKMKEIVNAAGSPETKYLTEKTRDAAYQIVQTAIDNNADLIVMGASGKSGFKKFVLGSVSQEVLGKSDCPAIIVH